MCFGFIYCQNTEVRTVNINGTARTYRLYVPAIYTGNESVPLVFNFHGYTSSAFEQENYGDFRPIADTANFILVHPEGLDGGTGNFWNSFSTIAPSNYDYQFVSQLIDSLKIEFAIDEARIYSTGLSNGGFFSYDLACFMSEKFAAIASVSGSMISQHENLCNPTRKVPVMQIHGTADQVVTYSGTGGIIECVGAETLVSSWVERNECSTVPSITNLPNSNTTDNSTVTHYVYEGANTSVEFYKITAGGHTWPGASFPIVGQNTNQDFSASKEIWRFFSQYSLNQVSASTNELLEKDITIFPNPSLSELTIQLNGLKIDFVNLFDSKGIKVLENQVTNLEEIKINTQNLYPGIYLLEIGKQYHKIIIGN
jgi:polyhydroxybutyrate depolymerase